MLPIGVRSWGRPYHLELLHGHFMSRTPSVQLLHCGDWQEAQG